MRNILIILSLYILNLGFIHSQTSKFTYEITDSLFVGKDVQKVVWDSKDTLWMIISDGLYKAYDDSLYHFTTENSTLTSEDIREIAVDSKDTVWMVTEKGLVKYDHVNFTTYDSTNTNIPRFSYHELAIDKDDNIWFSSSMARDGGLIRYDKKEWYIYTPDNSLLTGNFISGIVVDKENNVWAACKRNSYNYSHCLVKINNDVLTIYNEDSIGVPIYWFMFKTLDVDNDNNLYVKIDYGISSSDNTGEPSMLKYDGINWSVIDTVGGIGGWTWTFGFDSNNYIWQASFSGMYLSYYDGVNWNYWGRLDNSITERDIITGIDNNLWLCTTNGIYVLEAKETTSTESISQPSKINIYPNPATRLVTIDCDQFDYCEVYNIMGGFVAKSESQSVDLSGCCDGIYLLNVIDEKGKCIIKKVILSK